MPTHHPPLEICQRLQTLLSPTNPHLIYTANPSNLPIFKDLLSTQEEFEVEILSLESFKNLINQALLQEQIHIISNQISQDEDLAIQKLLNFILEKCIEREASDIHLQSQEERAEVRVRIDGDLQEFCTLSLEVFSLLSSYIKLECLLDIHEKRKPQDGKFLRIFDSCSFDFRTSFIPTTKGECIVIRILYKEIKNLSFQELGFCQDLKPYLNIPFGLIFVTGPTGSGKSTTLYSMLHSLKNTHKKIITLEDPVEYDVAELTQVSINEGYGFGFKEALRSILRQDPDIIMVGEIRDEETLSLAIRSSLTGHLVLSTLHTNDALSSIERLLDMNAKPYLISSILHLIISQRLVARLCPHCKTLAPTPKDLIPSKFWESEFFRAKGCSQCQFKGYQGRVLIYEILHLNQEIKSLIHQNEPKERILQTLKTQGFISMFEDALSKASQGLISIEEVLRHKIDI